MSIIYEPKGQAREYSALACNLYRGCSHLCAFCYGSSVLRITREEFNKPVPRNDIIKKLEQSATKRQRMGLGGQVLLCFTSDPYQHIEVDFALTRQAIEILHDTGHTVCVLTKGGLRSLWDVSMFGEGDAYAATLTLLDSNRSMEWEPGAALPAERIQALEHFNNAGIVTWTSLEPVIDPAVALEIIRRTHRFVGHYKVGKLNYAGKLPPHLKAQVQDIDWAQFTLDVTALLDSLDFRRSRTMGLHTPGTYYVKESLAGYLRGQR